MQPDTSPRAGSSQGVHAGTTIDAISAAPVRVVEELGAARTPWLRGHRIKGLGRWRGAVVRGYFAYHARPQTRPSRSHQHASMPGDAWSASVAR